MISQSSLDLLKSRLDVVDIVGSYVTLKKDGANFSAPCPFHDEKSASFKVSPKKQIYHCFGCGAHGDAIKFVQEYKKLTFAEAVEDIANDQNFTLQYDNVAEAKKDYSKLLESMSRYYRSQLSEEHREYLRGRGLTDHSIDAFEIGYAPASHTQLSYMHSQVFSTADAIECGVCAADEGRTYARLTDRISFPIRNRTGKLIGFGGRILSGDRAKYINSPQTPLFDKSSQLYGFHQATNPIHDRGTITITEGYLDVVMFHQAGIRTAVATMGTALTEAHAKLIAKNRWKTLLCYDGDRAGIAAALKASRLLSAHGIYGGVVIFPEGKDPADMVKSGEIEELMHLLKRPRPLIRFVIDQIVTSFNLALPHEKELALREIQAFMSTISELVRDEYIPIIAATLSIDPRHVTGSPSTPVPVAKLPDINVSEMNIIKTARENEGAFQYLIDIADASFFPTHYAEFEMLLRGDDVLDGLLLRDEITTYSHDEFIGQVKILLIDGHRRALNNVQLSPIDFDTKRSRINELNAKINRLQNDMRS